MPLASVRITQSRSMFVIPLEPGTAIPDEAASILGGTPIPRPSSLAMTKFGGVHGCLKIETDHPGTVIIASGDKTLNLESRILGLKCISNGVYEAHVTPKRPITITSRCVLVAGNIQTVSRHGNAPLWFVVTCMGRLNFIKQTAPEIVANPLCRYILVDWSCPEGSGDWIESNFPEAVVVRVTGREKFSISQARNSGAEAAPDGSWICFTDSDVLVDPWFADRVLPLCLPGHYLRHSRAHELGIYGTCVVRKSDWGRAGKYDSVFNRYGWDDIDFYSALEFSGVRATILPEGAVRHIPHDDTIRFANHNVTERGGRTNESYSGMKWSESRRKGRILSDAEREGLYAFASNRSCGCPVCSRPLIEEISSDGTFSPGFNNLAYGVGDQICALTTIREFARRHPKLKVRIASDLSLLEAFGDKLLHPCKCEYWMRALAPDNLLRYGDGSRHKNYLGGFLELVGIDPDGRVPELPLLSPPDGLYGLPYIAFCPRWNWTERENATQDLIQRIADEITSHHVVSPGLPLDSISPRHRELETPLDSVDYSFREDSILTLCRVVAGSAAVVTARSAAAHIAAAYGKPTFCWCPPDWMSWHVNYPKFTVVTLDDDVVAQLHLWMASVGTPALRDIRASEVEIPDDRP